MPVQPHLSQLEASGLIALASLEPELAYLFRHILIQQAASESLVRADRRRLHRLVGEILEATYPHRLDELAAELALHFAAAGERDRAVAYHRRAASFAEARYAHPEALQHLQAALDLLGGDDEASPARLAVLEAIADVHVLVGAPSRAWPIYQQVLALCSPQRQPDRWELLRLHRKILECLALMISSVPVPELEAAMRANAASLRGALALAEGQPPHVEAARTLIALAQVYSRSILRPAGWTLDWDLAERYARQALALAEALDLLPERSAALGVLSGAEFVRGNLRQRLELASRRLALSREPGFANVRERLNSLIGAGAALAEVGEYRQAIPHLDEAEQLAAATQAVVPRIYALRLKAHCWFSLDRWDDMLQVVDVCRSFARQHTPEQTGPLCFELALSASIHAWRGEAEAARALREESFAIMSAVGGPPELWLRQQHY